MVKIPRKPSVYHDLNEVIWKHIAADTYAKVMHILDHEKLGSDTRIHELKIRIINAFNSTYCKDEFQRKLGSVLGELNKHLCSFEDPHILNAINEQILTAKRSIQRVLSVLDKVCISYEAQEQTYIQDGVIEIAGLPMKDFASQSDYFNATLKLFGINDNSLYETAKRAYFDGFLLDNQDRDFITLAHSESWEMVDTITAMLLHQQISSKFPSISKYELNPNLGKNELACRRTLVIKDAYYLMGKIMSLISSFSRMDDTGKINEMSEDPIVRFLSGTGKNLTDEQIRAVRKVALAHSSHGLNSGELTARLAGSVRTTFPRALIASFNVRSGLLHAGAVENCMSQTQEYLNSSKSPEEFILDLRNKKELIFGFGHRIHKTKEEDGCNSLGKDPRVDFYILSTLEGFPEYAEKIGKLIEYAEKVRELYPNLGANTDFGATVLFHALELSPNIASGFLTAFRTVGVSSQIVNELIVKGNSRRPPFATVLPYT